jgi:hypothetical protein
MLELSIVEQPAPAAAPNLDMRGIPATTALVTPKRGDEFYVCNPLDEIISARESGEPFIAHAVIGMKPKRTIIEPGTIARIQEI